MDPSRLVPVVETVFLNGQMWTWPRDQNLIGSRVGFIDSNPESMKQVAGVFLLQTRLISCKGQYYHAKIPDSELPVKENNIMHLLRPAN